MKVRAAIAYREMERSRRYAFEHNDALPVQHGAPLGLTAELVQQGTVTLAEQRALDHHIAEALDLRISIPSLLEFLHAPAGS